VASPKQLRLLCFLLKSGSFRKTFGRAPLKEPELEPEPERSPAKQARSVVLSNSSSTLGYVGKSTAMMGMMLLACAAQEIRATD